MCETHGDHTKDKLDELKCWSGFHRVAGTKAGFPGSCAKNKTNEEGVAEGFNEIDDATNVVAIKKLSNSELMRYYQDFKRSASMTGDKQHHYALQHLANEIKSRKQGVAEGEYDSRKPFGVRYKVFAGREGRVTTKEYWTTSSEKLEKAVAKIEALGNFYEIDGYSYPKEQQGVAEGQHSCPHCGGEMVSEELMNEKKDACYYKVKSRYKVWPSAYASGALVKCRKSGADSWGNGGKKNESSILEGINRVDESLHDWFNKEKWVRMDTKGNIKGPCAKEPGEGKPKCLPQSKAHSLGKKGRASAASRKRREDPNPERSGKAINVNTKKKSNEGVAEGLSKRDQKDVDAIKAAIERLQAQLKQPNADKAAIQASIAHERKRLALYGQGVAEAQLDEKWSTKYKDSINCSNPKGFSQKAHCASKKK
jgi:molecular chaperone GrpE (heat shock protein)